MNEQNEGTSAPQERAKSKSIVPLGYPQMAEARAWYVSKAADVPGPPPHPTHRRTWLRILSLELNGFKSFADAQRMGFPSGMTAVVGPARRHRLRPAMSNSAASPRTCRPRPAKGN